MKTISNDMLSGLIELEKKTILGRVCRELLERRKNPVGVDVPELPEKPVRKTYSWSGARSRDCGYCGHNAPTVFDADDTPICAECADAHFVSRMQAYADTLAEMLRDVKTRIATAAREQG